MYQALYRKWRPVTFDDVVGQEHITTTLKNQVASGKPSHAYLFCGSRGTGKTSCSKILAKAVNCPNQSGGNPCGVCAICTGIDNESILDVTEIDAASNSGVDNIRELREEANFTPVATRYRVYIIDETHMLSTGAFNALLKIMEEPPPHVIFILATTEIHKVPATILSRCQRFDFQRIPSEIIANRLIEIAKKENAQLTDEGAFLIAKLSDGGMRDAISLLDLCVSTGGEINYQMVQEVAGLTDKSYLFEMIDLIIKEDYPGTLNLLNDLWKKSVDPVQLGGQLLSTYRDLLVVKSTKTPGDLVDATGDALRELIALSTDYSPERIFYSISTLSNTIDRMSRTPMRKTEFETGLLKLCNPAVNTSPEALLARIEKLERNLKHGVVLRKEPENVSEVEGEPKESTPLIEDTPASDLEKAIPFIDWEDVLSVLKDKNIALYSTLIDSSAYIVEDLLLVDAGSELFANMVRSDEYARNSLRDAAYTVTGITYRLGPYDKNKYIVVEEPDMLDDLIKSAGELGLNIDITE